MIIFLFLYPFFSKGWLSILTKLTGTGAPRKWNAMLLTKLKSTVSYLIRINCSGPNYLRF